MKKLSFVLAAICTMHLNTAANAQMTSGKIIYKQRIVQDVIHKDTIKNKDAHYNGMMHFINQSLTNNSDAFEFQLKFKEHESLYSMVDQLDIEDNRGHRIAVALSRGKDIFYTDLSSNKMQVQKTAFGKLFLITSDISDQHWTLHEEQKDINGYQCLKATTTKVIKNNKGAFNKKVIAWYTPAIPIPFGPKGYGNLPGLILELQEEQFILYASKLMMNPKKTVKFNAPTKGKHLTKEEFEVLGKELSNSFWKN